MRRHKTGDWFLGVDLGTGSCKSVVIDEKAAVLGFGTGEYPSSSSGQRWREQDPDSLLEGCIQSVRSALEQAGELPGACAGMSIGGALHSLVAVDRHGQPLTGVLTWADGRAVHQAERIRSTPLGEALYQQTGCPAHGMYPLYKAIWLRQQQPEIFQRAARYLSAKEYLFQRLTGEYVADYALAAGSGLLNAHSLDWNDASLETAGVKRSQLSGLSHPQRVFSGIHPEMANLMGLPASTKLVLGASDAVNSSLGCGGIGAGQATCSIGTSGALRIIAQRPVLDPKGRSWCYAIDREHWLVGGAINNGGIALSWLREALQKGLPGKAREAQLSHEDLLDLAGQVEPGAGGLVCLPYFAGERSPYWNLNARGMYFGLTLEHDLRHLARAVLEGVGLRIRQLQQVLGEIGVEIQLVRASGGFTASPLWMQITADILKRPIAKPAWGETACLGAAFWALLATGTPSRLEQTAEMVAFDGEYQPDANSSAVYDRIYPLFTQLYGALGESFEHVASLQEWLRADP